MASHQTVFLLIAVYFRAGMAEQGLNLLEKSLNVEFIFDSKWTGSTKDVFLDGIEKNMKLQEVFKLEEILTREQLGLTPITEGASILYEAEESSWLPGRVKWCGPGTDATHYGDLGTAPATDSCCREHDHCPISITADEKVILKGNVKKKWWIAGENCIKYGVKTRKYTLSHCECDEKFRQCLEAVRSSPINEENRIAFFVGNFFFNELKMECIAKDPRKNNLYVARNNDRFPLFATARSELESESTTVEKFNTLPECDNSSCQLTTSIGECYTPRRGEFREIEELATDVEVIETKTEIVRRVFTTREALLKMRVCNHNMKDHCNLPEKACGATLKTHNGEPTVVITFTD